MKTFHVRCRCLYAVLRYRGVEVWLNTFLTMVHDKTQMVSFTAQPLYPMHQMKRKQEQPQRWSKTLWRGDKSLSPANRWSKSSCSCSLQHSPAVKQAVTISGLPDLIVCQGVQGTNAMKQDPSYTSEFFLSQSKNSPHFTGHDRFIRASASIYW
jgi:hypothetical protein